MVITPYGLPSMPPASPKATGRFDAACMRAEVRPGDDEAFSGVGVPNATDVGSEEWRRLRHDVGRRRGCYSDVLV